MCRFGFDTFSASYYNPRVADVPRMDPFATLIDDGCQPWKDGRVNSAPHVLVIDGMPDTEAVLKAVLEPRGTQVERKRGVNLQHQTGTLARPDVVVIDLDDASADATASQFGESRRILIGSVQTPVDANERFLAKPFQYPELLQTIEDLLAMPRAS